MVLLLCKKLREEGMTMAGRKPKPTALKKLEGNPGKRKLNTKEPIPAKGMPNCPEWLLPEAKKECSSAGNGSSRGAGRGRSATSVPSNRSCRSAAPWPAPTSNGRRCRTCS